MINTQLYPLEFTLQRASAIVPGQRRTSLNTASPAAVILRPAVVILSAAKDLVPRMVDASLRSA